MLNSKFVRALALTTAIAAFGSASHEALATNATGHALATILQAITVTENTQMNFASISAPAAGGNVVLAPAGTIGPVAASSSSARQPPASLAPLARPTARR